MQLLKLLPYPIKRTIYRKTPLVPPQQKRKIGLGPEASKLTSTLFSSIFCASLSGSQAGRSNVLTSSRWRTKILSASRPTAAARPTSNVLQLRTSPAAVKPVVWRCGGVEVTIEALRQQNGQHHLRFSPTRRHFTHPDCSEARCSQGPTAA